MHNWGPALTDCLFVCLFVCLSIWPFACLSSCLASPCQIMGLNMCLSPCLSGHYPRACLLDNLSDHFVCLLAHSSAFVLDHLSDYLSFWRLIHVLGHLSNHLPACGPPMVLPYPLSCCHSSDYPLHVCSAPWKGVAGPLLPPTSSRGTSEVTQGNGHLL